MLTILVEGPAFDTILNSGQGEGYCDRNRSHQDVKVTLVHRAQRV